MTETGDQIIARMRARLLATPAAPGTVLALQHATCAAQERTGNKKLGTHVEAGKFQVVETTFVKRLGKVKPISGWLSLTETISFLNAL